MNTVTLHDFDNNAASGNSLLSMVQMLAMRMGVATACAVLASFTGYFGNAKVCRSCTPARRCLTAWC